MTPGPVTPPPVTSEQADAAKYLTNTAECYGALIELAARLPEEIREQLRTAHADKTTDMCCNAHCEGLDCCVDILTGDLGQFGPERVRAAEELLKRYRAQLHAEQARQQA